MKPRHLLNKMMAWTGYEIVRQSKKRGVDWLTDLRKTFSDQMPRLIFDVGAHEGESIKRFRTSFPEAIIHSFEPGVEAFESLRRNLNSEESRRVHLHQMALGASDGEATFFTNEKSATNSMLPVGSESSLVAKGRARVRLRALDSFCSEEKIDRIDLLKIDVQGYELEVLRGALGLLGKRRIRAIFLEVFFAPVYEGQAFFGDIYQFLTKASYRFSGLYDLSYQSGDSPRWGDALFLA